MFIPAFVYEKWVPGPQKIGKYIYEGITGVDVCLLSLAWAEGPRSGCSFSMKVFTFHEQTIEIPMNA